MNESSKHDICVGHVIDSIIGVGVITKIRVRGPHHMFKWANDEIMTNLDIEEIEYILDADIYE